MKRIDRPKRAQHMDDFSKSPASTTLSAKANTVPLLRSAVNQTAELSARRKF